MINIQNYITDSKLFKTFTVENLLIVEYKCLVEDHQSAIWAHDNYFAYVLGGEKKWKTPVCEYTARSGNALFVRKGANTVYQYFEQPFLVIFIFISDNFLRNLLSKHPKLVGRNKKARSSGFGLVPLSCNDVLQSFFQSMTVYFSQPVPPGEEILKLKTEELILNILTQPGNHLLKQFFETFSRQDNKANMREVMQDNYAMPLSIHEYARLCGRSLASFRRDFNKYFDTTPGKWILARRLELSRFLLETTDERINEIVYKTGFKNKSHFNKVFKAATGMSPNEYRQQLPVAG